MTLLLLGAIPVLVVGTVALFPYRDAGWTVILVVLGVLGAVIGAAATSELWRRLGTLADLTGLHEELVYRASHDLLLGIANRELLHSELAAAIRANLHEPGRVGLLFLDLDRFKFVNDTMGHAAGDELLKATARRIEDVIRDEDALVARVGGDELVVLMRHVHSNGHLGSVARKLLGAFARPFVADGVEVNLGCSIGGARWLDGESADDLYRHADAALYKAKSRGGGVAVFADAALRAERTARVQTERAIRQAFAEERIEAWFQPEVDLITCEVIGAEVLARWRTPNGVEQASSFIEVARRSGLLEELTVQMVMQLWAWRAETRSSLSVGLNVSLAQLPTLLELHRGDPLGRSLVNMRLEIPSSEVLADFGRANVLLGQVRDLGAQVVIDDFGIGDSALRMLVDLPVDGIKINRELISRIDNDWRARQLVAAVSDFGRSCGMIVVAEGIERAEQASLLAAIGIDRGQGFLFSDVIDRVRFDRLCQAGLVTDLRVASGF